MHIRRSLLASARVGLIFPLAAKSGAAQAPTEATEIPHAALPSAAGRDFASG